jgi:DNA modification methylase
VKFASHAPTFVDMNTRNRVVELIRVPAAVLVPHPLNYRVHGKAQTAALKGILAEVGIADALLVRRLDDGRFQIIDGHLRSDVLKDAEVPCLLLDLNDLEAKKLLTVLDPIGAMAGADADNLDALLKEVSFSDETLNKLIGGLAKDAGLEFGTTIDEDDVPAAPAEPVTVRGDVWVIGDHRVICGDATSAEDVGRVLAGAKPFLMVCDQPYGVNYDPSWRNEAGLAKTARVGKVANDDRVDWSDAFKLFTGDVAYAWHAGIHAGAAAASLVASGFHVRAQIVWSKSRFAISRGHYHWGHEPAYYAVRQGATAKWCGDRTQSTIWEIAGKLDLTDEFHGTQKPVECMARPIRNHGAKDDAVYDCFLGTGTTLIAAEQLGRRCFGLEIEPKYCDVIVKRWQNLTKRKAVNETRPEVEIA